MTPKEATVVTLLSSLTRGAVSNARRSLDELSRALTDRRLLQEQTGEHGDLQVLPLSECHELLEQASIGRLAYVARAGMPDIVPVNFVWHEGAVYIRSGPGPKLQAAQRGDVVAFEVDAVDEQLGSAWSVVVTGRARIAAPVELFGQVGPQPWINGPRRHLIRIDPRRIEGRRML